MPIKNTSDSAKTVKAMLTSFSSDSWSIDGTMEYIGYNNGENTNIITAYSILDNYRSFFENPSNNYVEEVDVDKKYYQNVSAFSEYYYGTSGLYWLILYFSKIPSNMKFTKPRITVLRYDALGLLNKLLVKYKDDIIESKNNPTTYSANKIKSKVYPIGK